MALWKYVTRDNKKGTTKVFLPTPKETEKGDKAVKQALSELRTKSRGNYNSYTPRQRAQIGQYAAENGPTRAAAHFSSLWKLNINESTARRLKSEYLQKLRQASDQAKKDGKPVTVDTLVTKEKKRPLLLGEEMDGAVQEYIKSLRTTGAVVNTVVVMAAAVGIVAARDVTKLREYDGHLYGGHIDITKSWARSLLNRMGYVKRKCSNAGKITVSEFDEVKDVFLADVAAEVVMRDIPSDLVLNWDQTGLSIIPTGNWTMHEAGAKVVSIAHADDKRQITAVLAASAKGDYLCPQLLYKGKTPRCHPTIEFPTGWDIWHSHNHWSNEDTMKRYIEKIIIPYVSGKRKELGLQDDHPALAIYDGFRGQTTEEISSILTAHNILTVQIPANCTDKLQPMDIAINKPMKHHLRANFQTWYAKEVSKQLKFSSAKEIKVDVNLSVVKNPSAKWIMDAWKDVEIKPQMVINGFRKAGILDAISV